MSVSSDLPLTDVELRDLAMSLIESWNAGPLQVEMRPGREQGQFVVTYGLAAHAHRLAKAALLLLENGLTLEAAPTVRSLYEHSLTAQWVGQYKDGAAGFTHEYLRARRATVETLLRTGRQSAREKAQQMEDIDPWEDTPHDAEKPARHFGMLCQELNVTEELYAYYRIMSGMAHPTGHIVDSYVESVDPLVVSREPQGHEQASSSLYLCCVSLVLAGRALDWLDRSHPRREKLRRAARTLGIKPELQLSEAFYTRIRKSKAKQAAKR